MTAVHEHRRTIPDVVSDVFTHLTTLFRKEMQLARTEVSEKFGQALSGMVMLVIGAVLLIPALVILLMAGVTALTEAGLESYWASLIVGGIALLIGAILALVGLSRLKAENLAPSRTIDQLQRDAAIAKNQIG